MQNILIIFVYIANLISYPMTSFVHESFNIGKNNSITIKHDFFKLDQEQSSDYLLSAENHKLPTKVSKSFIDSKDNLHNPELKPFAFSSPTETLESKGIKMRNAGIENENSLTISFKQDWCADLTIKTLSKFPDSLSNSLKNLTFHFSNDARRGLGGGDTIILRCVNVSPQELVAVLTHELAHVQDTGVFKGSPNSGSSEFFDGKKPVYKDDPSLNFYRISFSDDSTLNENATKFDFVSGYAMTDPFEDFAESFVFYVLHGDIFREMLSENHSLELKYLFLRNEVFDEVEFGDFSSNAPLNGSRVYDSTVISYNLEKFLAI